MKKSNKGYTIIELLLVISIIVIITTITIISFITIKNKQKEKDYNNMVDYVKTASELYLRNSSSYKDNLDTIKAVNLPVKELVESGYLDENYTVNPKNNESIKELCITVTIGSVDELEFGEIRSCGSFLGMFPNNLVIYKGQDINSKLMEGIYPYDKDGNPVDKSNVVYETEAITRLNNNINNEIEINYTYDGKIYTRAVTLKEITLSLSPESGNIIKTKTITSTINGSNYGTLSCSTSNSAIATCTISETTVTVTGVAVGSATITVTESNLNKTATFAATVNDVTLTLSATSGSVTEGSSKTATISGSNYGTLSCSTSNSAKATCTISGTTLTITGVVAGSATITVTESNINKTATYAITVNSSCTYGSCGGRCCTYCEVYSCTTTTTTTTKAATPKPTSTPTPTCPAGYIGTPPHCCEKVCSGTCQCTA